jgi:hypothetical protein
MKGSGGRRMIRGGLALLAGGVAAGVLVARRKRSTKGGADRADSRRARDRWARPGMEVTFRAELMPGRDPDHRTFHVVELLPSGRVTLDGVAGEHTENEFEPVR